MTRRLALAVLLAVAGTAPAQQYNFAVNQVAAAAGTSGTLEVTLTYTGSNPSAPIAAFQFGLVATTVPGVTFTGLDVGASTTGYIFGDGGMGIGANLPNGSGPAFPGSVTAFVGNDLGPIDGVVLSSGQTVRLGRVTFDLAAGTTADIPITFAPADSGLSDAMGGTITGLVFTPGSVTPVPEPAAVLMVAGFALLATRWGGVCATCRRSNRTPSGC